jgi:hypothetical protein
MNSLPQLTHEPQHSPTSRRVPRPFTGWSRSGCLSRNWRSDLVQFMPAMTTRLFSTGVKQNASTREML